MTDSAAPRDELLGATIAGRYRIISRLGAGGMGVAYRAWDALGGLPVVIKIPKRAFLDDPSFAERFSRETRLLQGLAHPHIVPIVDVGQHEGVPYVVLRFLPGGSLSNRRLRDEQGKPLPNPAGMLHLWLPAVAAALDHVHSQGVVHRDVKPANIFFDAFWGAYLGDFGIAKIVEESDAFDREQTLTATHMGIGTQEYMSPEQFMPKARIDGRADQYALAVTVYDMLAGQKPFTGKKAHLIVEVTTQAPPPLQAKRPDLPASLAEAVARGLAKKPTARFDTCQAFAAAVLLDVPVLEDEPGVARLLCPHCANMLKLPVAAGGKNGKCPRCRSKMRVAEDLGALWLLDEDTQQRQVESGVGSGPTLAGETMHLERPADDSGGVEEFRPVSNTPPSGRTIHRRRRLSPFAVVCGLSAAVVLGGVLLGGLDGSVETLRKMLRAVDAATRQPRAVSQRKSGPKDVVAVPKPDVQNEPAKDTQNVPPPNVRREPPLAVKPERVKRRPVEAAPPPPPPAPPPRDREPQPSATEPAPVATGTNAAPPGPEPTPATDDADPGQLQAPPAVSPLDQLTKPDADSKGSSARRKKPRAKGGPFDGRRKPAELAAEGGGGDDTEQAVDRALEWLAAHQLADGGWSFDFHLCPACDGRCGPSGQTHLQDRCAATALAILPFLGRGYTHQKGPYKREIEKGLGFLVNLATAGGGKLYGKGNMYSQGVAAIALGEAYGMTSDRRLAGPTQLAINFIMNAQDPRGGGWRYEPKQGGDTSASGWQLMALATAVAAKLQVNPLTIKKATAFLDSVQSANGAMYGYTDPGKGNATTAVGLLCRMQLGWDTTHPAVQRGVTFLADQGPSEDLYHDYYATQVMYHFGGEQWIRWNNVMKAMLLENQARAGHEAGSFFHGLAGGHGPNAGGRLYCTAMATLILEVYYRYPSMYGAPDVDRPANN